MFVVEVLVVFRLHQGRVEVNSGTVPGVVYQYQVLVRYQEQNYQLLAKNTGRPEFC